MPETAQQGGDIRARWAWVEPAAWTERMLATLETGIEGGKWFRLIDKVWSAKNLAGSLQKVVAKGGSAGIDNQSARAVQEHPVDADLKSYFDTIPHERLMEQVGEKIADGKRGKMASQEEPG